MPKKSVNVMWFEDLSRGDVALVGGKNSSLGEMVRQLGRKGIKVPGGFATTADAYRAYLTANDLDARIDDVIARWQDHKITLHEAGSQVRAMILQGDLARRTSATTSWRPIANCRAAPGPPTCPSPSGPPPRPRICRMPASPASRKPI